MGKCNCRRWGEVVDVRQPIRIRPASSLLAAVISVGGVAAMGSLFPEYSAGRVATTMA